MFQEVGRVLYLSECIRSRAMMCAILYIRRDIEGLVRQLRIIEDLVFALDYALTDEGRKDNDD